MSKQSKNNIKLGEYDWVTPLNIVVQLIEWPTCDLGEGGYSVHLLTHVETEKSQAVTGHPILLNTRLGGPDMIVAAYNGIKLAQSLAEGIATIIEVRDSVTDEVIKTLNLVDVLEESGDDSDFCFDTNDQLQH